MRIRFALGCLSSDMVATVTLAGVGWLSGRLEVLAAGSSGRRLHQRRAKVQRPPRQAMRTRGARAFPSRTSARRLLPRLASFPSLHQQAIMTSSNQIPNLKTLLGPGRGGGLRARGRGRGGPGSSSEEVRDNAVKGTDQDAAGSRVSCVELGYLHDPYAKLFATQPSTRRLPLLNRGTGYDTFVCVLLKYIQALTFVLLQSISWSPSIFSHIPRRQNR